MLFRSNDTATTEIYTTEHTLSLHDALPICAPAARLIQIPLASALALPMGWAHSGVFWGVFVSETEVGVFTL